jgi:hypothetical protein
MSLFKSILAFNLFNTIPWTAIFLFTQYIGIRLYYIKKSEECSRIQNRVKGFSHTTDGGKGCGYAFGYWYIIHMSVGSDDPYAYIISTESSYKTLTEVIEDKEASLFDQGWKPPLITEKSRIAIYDRSGQYGNTWFRKREREARDTARGKQDEVVRAIIEDYMKRRHTVVHIHGPPGTGKSMIGILIANEFASSFCNTLKPWMPGDTLGSILNEVEPTPQKPLILVFDEFDMVIDKIHKGIICHKNIPTAVPDKAGWNHMLDSIQRGMYPNIILILTSNKDPEYINSLDSSYIRKGRVDLTFEMTEILI